MIVSKYSKAAKCNKTYFKLEILVTDILNSDTSMLSWSSIFTYEHVLGFCLYTLPTNSFKFLNRHNAHDLTKLKTKSNTKEIV